MRELNAVTLGGLRAVEAVARLGSLAAAADEMAVTVGAVSQRVQRVEAQLGTPLFHRGPKGLTPTQLGGEVAARLTRAMTELATAVRVARRGGDDRTLTVSVAPVLAEKWLVWRLQDFNMAHPDVRIRVDASITLVDPNATDVDVCLRVGRGGWPDVRAEKLLDHRVFPVCSPVLAERLAGPADLARVPIIRDTGNMFTWDTWLAPNGLDSSILGEGPSFSDGALCLDAAIAGQGVFLAWETVASNALRTGSLVAPFPGRYPTGHAYWFVTGRDIRKPRRIAAFEAWLRDELRRDVGADAP